MRTGILSFCAILAVLCGGLTYAPALAQNHPARVAPADEYFGHLKMSILGVRNQLRDISTRLGFAPQRGAALLGSASMVEDAIRDWEHKYPADPWLPKNIFMLSQVYGQIGTGEAQRRASATLQWLIRRYPGSIFARTARAQIVPASVVK